MLASSYTRPRFKSRYHPGPPTPGARQSCLIRALMNGSLTKPDVTRCQKMSVAFPIHLQKAGSDQKSGPNGDRGVLVSGGPNLLRLGLRTVLYVT